MIVFRSVIYSIAFYLWTLILALCYLPLLVLPRRIMVRAARLWAGGVLTLLRVLVGVRLRVEGRDQLPDGPVLVAAKHQSAFETFALPLILSDPAFILKRELLWIPFFGWYLGKSGVIAIDRKAGTKALKAMVRGAEAAKTQGRAVIIFPEGTRTAPGQHAPYHSGVAMLYGALGVPAVPVALNSGLFWRKREFVKRPGTVTIAFQPPIAPGLDRRRFMVELERRIEEASTQLAQDGASA